MERGCNHEFIEIQDVSDIIHTIKILKCTKCHNEFLVIDGYIHQRKAIKNPEAML